MDPFIGQIMLFAGNFAPRGWAFCNGQLLSIAQNQALFSILGTMYGGDGRTTFALPDLRSRAPLHAGMGPGLTNRKQGVAGGAEQVTLTNGQMPSHSHSVGCTATAGNQTSPVGHILGSAAGPAQVFYGAPLHDAIAVWDAKNYPGSGTVLPDPIGGFNMTIDGSPTFNAGVTPFFTMDGVNDRMWHADVAGLELADGGAKTLLISCHLRGGDPGQLIGKSDDISAASAYYGVRNALLDIAARTGNPLREDRGTGVSASRQTHGGIFLNAGTHRVEAVEDGSLTGSPDTGAYGNTANSADFSICADSNQLQFVEADFYGAAAWDRQLSQAEINNFQAALDAGPVSRQLFSTAAPDQTMNAATIGNSGSDQGHDNMQPFLTLNYVIALVGVFPSRN